MLLPTSRIPLRRLAFAAALAFTAATSSAAHAAPPPPDSATTIWQRVFGDEFSGLGLDPTKWTSCYWWATAAGCTNGANGEQQWYRPGNVVVSGGALRLRAKDERYFAPDGKLYAYTSGMVSTGPSTGLVGAPPRFQFTYGYAEMRAWLPRGQGLWPAFWMLPVDRSWPPELDVMENIGSEPTTVAMGTHYTSAWGGAAHDAGFFTGPDFAAGWHTFGLDWRPDRLVAYVDGVERWSTTDPVQIPDQPMYLIANLAVGGRWPGPASIATPFPSDLAIDYVRVWQQVAAPAPSGGRAR